MRRERLGFSGWSSEGLLGVAGCLWDILFEVSEPSVVVRRVPVRLGPGSGVGFDFATKSE